MTEPVAGEPMPQLQLFVVGDEPNSRRARANLGKITAQFGHHLDRVEVVDVLKEYKRALDSNILVAPLLIISTATTRVTVAGDLTDLEKVVGILNSLMERQ